MKIKKMNLNVSEVVWDGDTAKFIVHAPLENEWGKAVLTETRVVLAIKQEETKEEKLERIVRDWIDSEYLEPAELVKILLDEI